MARGNVESAWATMVLRILPPGLGWHTRNDPEWSPTTRAVENFE